jgi:hypothetical protein
MNAEHYVNTVVKPVLGSWWKTLPDQGSDYEIMEDGNRAHCAALTNKVRAELGINKVLRPHLASTSICLGRQNRQTKTP